MKKKDLIEFLKNVPDDADVCFTFPSVKDEIGRMLIANIDEVFSIEGNFEFDESVVLSCSDHSDEVTNFMHSLN